VFPCGNKEGGKKGYLTILEASLRVESLRPDKPRTMTVHEQAGRMPDKSRHDRLWENFILYAIL